MTTAGRTLQQTAAAVGALRWSELQLYRLLGGWVATTDLGPVGGDVGGEVGGEPVATDPEPDPARRGIGAEVDAMLDRHSQHAAWRADQWWDRLPVLAGVEREGLVRPPSAEAEALAAALGVLDEGLARLAGAYRVALPRLAAAYAWLRAGSVPVSDGPVLRTLDRVDGDLLADWREGEQRFHRLVRSAAAAGVAAGAVAGLEAILAGDVTDILPGR